MKAMEISICETAIGCKTRNVGFIEGWYVKPEYRQRALESVTYYQYKQLNK